MEQHPVPQNISSYQFHLVGDMTLKQFLELAGGVLVGVLFYATSLPGIIKWPLILISAGIGAALAFVPFEERPLEQWIVAFFRSVYSPTLFHWEKVTGVKYFQDESTQAPAEGQSVKASPFQNVPFLNKLESSENSYLSRLTNLFNPNTPSNASQQQFDQAPIQKATVSRTPPGGNETVLTIDINKNVYEGRVLSVNPVEPQVQYISYEPKREVKIPQAGFVSVDKSWRPQIVVEEKPSERVNLQTTKVPTTINAQNVTRTTEAKFSLDAAPPSVPTIPNTISGQVMDANKKIIEGAILEILDQANRPVRALKTNKAGHFIIVTPLLNGKYKIVVDKEGYNFDPIEFETKGEIIEPMAIIAKR